MAQQEKFFQSKRMVAQPRHEYEHFDFLKTGQEPLTLPDTAGDCDKFHGFFRRQGDPTSAARNAENERLERRRDTHDDKRRVQLSNTINVSGRSSPLPRRSFALRASRFPLTLPSQPAPTSPFRLHIVSQRNGFNVITGQEWRAERDNFSPRGNR